MKVVLMDGGLGNQMFQYIFARFVELYSGEPVFIDDAFFFYADLHNGYEVEKVFPNAKPRLLSKEFSPGTWDQIVQYVKNEAAFPEFMNNGGNNFFVVFESGDIRYTGNMVKVPANQFTPDIAITQGNVYYFGYWINKRWLSSIADSIMRELEFPPIPGAHNQDYTRLIEKTNSVAVHIRRGDFVDIKWTLEDSFYFNSIKEIAHRVDNPTFFIFSDDLNWCRENSEGLGFEFAKGNLVYVEGNMDKQNNYVDMQLMSMCKHMVIANSSFSYLAALLNRNENKLIANPTAREL